jgi:hypothetical protein
MVHTISAGPFPNIKIMQIVDSVTYEAMAAVDELGLNQGQPMYILLDISQMTTSLPDDFLGGARNSFFIHPNMAHTAMFTQSTALATLAKMISKLTRRKDKLTIHGSYQDALNHLLALSKQPSF